jgi:hypothetical protein
MKILVILTSNKMDKLFIPNIINLKEKMEVLSFDNEIDYAGISSENDFINYEEYITFKYKSINSKKQISKLNDFLSTCNLDNYDWYIKIRPEVFLNETINLKNLLPNSINGRARKYQGTRKIKYGLSVGGKGPWSNIRDVRVNNKEIIELDDQIFIFDNNVLKLGAFYNVNLNGYELQNETTQTGIWLSKRINLNVIGINMILDYRDGRQMWSGDL